MPLSPEQRAQLDSIVAKMDASGASSDDIRAIVADFTAKNGAPEVAEPVAQPSGFDQATDALLQNPLTTTAGIALKALPGGIKGVANTVTGLGEMVHRGAEALGVAEPTEAFQAAREQIQPENAFESAGMAGEQIAEFAALPIKGIGMGRALKAAGASGALTGVQGGSRGESFAAGALSAIPAGRIVEKGADWIGSKAAPLVRAAIKPTVAAMRRVAGAAGEGLDAKAQKLVQFIIENRVTTPEKAQKILVSAEQELQRLLAVKGAPTDAPQRALRYLDSLEKQAAKAGLVDDARAIRNAAEEVFSSDMGIDVPGVPGARAIRGDVTAKEALDLARTRSKLQNRKQWGEMKTSSVEASKAIERAQRDAVKSAVPEAKPILQREGNAIRAKEILDRMEFRSRNRDAVSLPAHVIAAGEIASGRAPILAFAANWLRNNQLKAGLWANDLSKAIKAGNAPMVADILKQIGVAEVQNMVPANAQ